MTKTISCLMLLCVCACGALAAEAAGLAAAVPVAGNAWHLALADVTGDGRGEIIYACYHGKVCCQDERSGQVLWQYETGAFPYHLAAGDVNGDGRAETFVASADGSLYALGPDGALLWTHTTRAPLYHVALARLADAVWVLTGGVDRNLYVLKPDGEVVKTLPQDRVVRLIGAGDLDGDGEEEVVCVAARGEVQALKGAELEQLWRTRTGPIVDGEEKPGKWRRKDEFQSLEVADLDGDGRCELLFGLGCHAACGIRVLSCDGTLRWDKADGLTGFRDGTVYSHTEVTACDLDPAPGQEMIALNARRLFVFDAEGNELTSAVAPIAFTDIRAATPAKGTPELWLGSSPNGDDRIYRMRPAEGWEDAFGGLQREGKMRRITENLAKLREQIAAYEGMAPPGSRYVHIVAGGQPNTPGKLAWMPDVIEWYRERFPYESCIFAVGISVAADELVPGFFKPDHRTQGRRLPPADIVALLRVLEESETHFIVNMGHGCEPQIALETAEAILRACPEYCLGFRCSENSDYGDRLEHYFNDYWFPLMDLCKEYEKKAILVEKGAWWIAVPAMARFRKLVDGTYADVLVPSVEDSNSRSPELNLAGRAGLFAAGAVNQWSARTIADELCWNRYFEWEFPMTGHPFLRRQLAAVALGARFFEYSHTLHWYTQERERRPTVVATELIEPLVHMLGKGLLVPPERQDMLGVSPCAIRMRQPSEQFLTEAFNFHHHDDFAWSEEEAASPFEGIACHWGAAPVRENYVGHYLFEQDRHYGNFVPATPFGFPLIVPEFVELSGAAAQDCAWETDGRHFYDDGRALSGIEARPQVLESFEDAARGLPFRAEGHVFLQAQRIDEATVRMILIDPGFLDPDDREVALHVRSARPVRELVDLLSGASLEVSNGVARVTVPAGAFRLLEARF